MQLLRTQKDELYESTTERPRCSPIKELHSQEDAVDVISDRAFDEAKR